jgi:hypothetical protein
MACNVEFRDRTPKRTDRGAIELVNIHLQIFIYFYRSAMKARLNTCIPSEESDYGFYPPLAKRPAPDHGDFDNTQ